jgi:EAL domain-containing protein (putative c-di-GMP-specific phosphodiesterase class I)
MRLLVFDDDAAVGRLISRIAEMAGLEASAVTNAEAFRQGLRTAPPQIVVLDLQLGGTDGVEQLRLLADQRYRGSVILMSGCDSRVLATTRALAESLALTVEAVLAKPIRAAELEEVLQRLQHGSQPPTGERLLEAIRSGEMQLDFQPVVTRRPRTLKQLEALIRWNHPTMGRLLPGTFLETAEANPAVIDALTEWVVTATTNSYVYLVEHGIRVPMAVNISHQNLHDLALPDRIEHRLRRAGMPAEHLCCELTESAAFQDAARSMDVLTRLRLKGMHLAIDDFGTGYSSFKLLRQMPFSTIKVDRSFVSDVTMSRDSRAIVKSIVDLAHNMEMECIVEGVETEETAALLESFNAGALQGYLIARPMSVEAIVPWLAEWMEPARVNLKLVPTARPPVSLTAPLAS